MGQWPVKATAVTVVIVIVTAVTFTVGVFEIFADHTADSELTLASACEIAVFNESQSNIIKKTCCKGYDLTQNETQCRTICKNPCIQGMCISSNVCKCDKNQLRLSYNTGNETQRASDYRMESTEYNLKHTYDCSVNSYCNYTDGSCICLPGYTGNNCEYLCSTDFYGERCQFKCQCQNGGLCNLKNGNCICRTGYKGKYCELSCPMGFYGSNCIDKCKCQNGAKCDVSNGKCTCPVGYTGQYCELQCPPGFFGYKCQNKCKCQHEETCDPVNGRCNCIPGYIGNDCRMVCPSNKYGLNCNFNCSCFNGALCRPTDGVCLCETGFFGPTCSQGNKYFVGLEIEPESEFSVSWIFDFSIVSSLFIISSACTWILFCYFFCYRRQIQKYNQTTLNNIELHKHARKETQISDANMTSSSKMFDVQTMRSDITHVEKNKSSANELFYSEYSSIDRLSNDYKEHIYLEIDESVIKQRPDDLYDHLDFLRPTGSWKPHYQKTLAWQEQSSSSSTKEYNIT